MLSSGSMIHEAPQSDDSAVDTRATPLERSSLADLLQWMGLDGATPGTSVPIVLRRVHAGEVLFHEAKRAEAVYFIRAGTFKSTRTSEDGYEQVLGFAGRGEALGFDALCAESHPSSAIALEESSVYAVLVRDLLALEQRQPEFARLVHLSMSRALTRQGELADVMAAVAAEVRLARFLVQWSRRSAGWGQSPRRFYLRMSRRDIASHLGVAHETVSRSFGALAGWGQLRVNNREIEIVDMEALKLLARSTRRNGEDPILSVHRVTRPRAAASGSSASHATH